MMKKIFKLMAVAQAIAFPVVSVNRAEATTEKEADTFKETNILYQNAIVDSIFITNPNNVKELNTRNINLVLSFSPVSDLSKRINFFSFITTGSGENYTFYEGFAMFGWPGEIENNYAPFVDLSNLSKFINYPSSAGSGYAFGEVYDIPEEKRNKNCIVHFKEPVKVKYILPGLENFVFNPKPVDKFALTYNGLLNGYAYNMLGGREDIDPAQAYEYIKNHAKLISDTSDWWNGLTMFRVATFKNGSGMFDIVGIVSGPGNVGLFSNYNSPNHSKIKELSNYQKKSDGTYEITATHQLSINEYYACTIVDETASKFVLTSGADFSSFLDYAKSVGYPEGYAQGFTDGQNNPTFKSFIVSAFDACSAFFNIPILGSNITIGTLIGSFVGLGALFLIIKLFR